MTPPRPTALARALRGVSFTVVVDVRSGRERDAAQMDELFHSMVVVQHRECRRQNKLRRRKISKRFVKSEVG